MIDQGLMAREFPVTRDWTYLSTASNGVVPLRARRYLERYFQEAHYLELGDHYAMFDDLASLRRSAAALHGGEECNWALLPNTCHGINTVAAALPWKAGENVVLADFEFPANVYPWLNLSARGVGVNWVRSPDMKASAELLMERCDEDTRAIAVSGIQFGNGYAPDLKALGAFCRERDIWLVVDGIQGLGNRDWDLASLGVDFVASGAQKWLLGPRGAGLLFLSGRALAAFDSGELKPAHLGWLNWKEWRFDELLDFGRELTREGRRLEIGTYAFHDLIAMGLALDLIRETGLGNVAAHCDGLRNLLIRGLEDRGLAKRFAYTGADDPPERRSQILALRCDDAPGVAARLRELKVSASPREGALRVSFHLYNRDQDVERLLDLLADF